jgi:hypothetical protein
MTSLRSTAIICAVTPTFFLLLFSPQWAMADNPNGNPFTVLCPTGSFVTGFNGRVGDWIDQRRLICSNWSGTNQVLQAGNILETPDAQIGRSRGGLEKQVQCPNDFAVVGWQVFSLRSENHLARGQIRLRLISNLGQRCSHSQPSNDFWA